MGWYFSISGVDFANSSRPFNHTLKKFFIASLTLLSPFPYYFLASASYFFASLHSSLNHGASVFPHLLGFFGTAVFISFTTCARTAYCSMHSSTAAALSSLLLVSSFIKSCRPRVIPVFGCAPTRNLQSSHRSIHPYPQPTCMIPVGYVCGFLRSS